jgi:AraC-like DNA-binding protein
MERFDRLTTLIDRFKLAVSPAPLERATLVVLCAQDGTPERALLRSRGVGFDPAGRQVLFSARVDWSGQQNPLFTALPETVDIDLSGDADSIGLIRVMQSEIAGQRCGVDSVLSRLGEVLIVRMLRAQIEAGSTQPGLLAGLSNSKLSRAIVAMHGRPGRAWRNEELAQIAGMSLSHFAEIFVAQVGEPPAAYLRRWRLTLARQDVSRGDRVDVVARRYGFSSSEGFTRAFKRHYGVTPIALRHGGSSRGR